MGEIKAVHTDQWDGWLLREWLLCCRFALLPGKARMWIYSLWELSLNTRVRYTQDIPGGDLWAQGRGCTGWKEPGAGESSGGQGRTPGQLGRSIARSAPPAHPADKLGWEGFARIYLQDWDSSWYGELLAAAELMPVKAFPAGYEIAIL